MPSSDTDTGGAGGATAAPTFDCAIRAPGKVKAGQPVTVHFRLALASKAVDPVYVLDWRTPLEGLRGDDFDVVRDGKAILYSGPMFKRGNPAAKSYRTLASSAPLEADVDLALAYDFGKPGKYRVTFKGHIWDLVLQKAEVPRPLEKHQPAPLQCAGVEVEIVKG